MELYVCGISLEALPPTERLGVEFSRSRLIEAVVRLKRQSRCESSLLLATCDRVELWTIGGTEPGDESLCRALGLSPLAWKGFAYGKRGAGAVRYLFELACGMHSSLFGEDLVASQIGEALQRSRDCGCTSAVLEQLAREAITTAKRVHSKVDLAVPDRTVAAAVREELARRYEVLEGLPVLVIGSSALARLVAEELLERKVAVTMTIRDMEKADLLIPSGACPLNYDRRFERFSSVAAVVSATKGMEYTVTADRAGYPHLYFDLASRPDIDPAVGRMEDNCLLDIPSLGCPLPERDRAVAEANRMIRTAVDRFFAWLEARSSVGTIRQISEDAANDLVFRLHSPLTRLGLGEEDGAQFRSALVETAKKAVAHQLYAQKKGKQRPVFLDLSRKLVSSPAFFAGDPPVEIENAATLEENGYRVKRISMGSHSGTHIDSPAHLFADGKPLDRYPVESFFAKAFVLDCRKRADLDLPFVSTVPSSVSAVLFATGWESGRQAGTLPVLTVEAASYLVGRGISLFGFDAPSCDRMEDEQLPIHRIILSAGGLVIENLCNLPQIAGRCVDLTALPLSVEGSDGCPARVVAAYTP